jgi:predicted lipoprotein with Yx(FWY)xxD motif
VRRFLAIPVLFALAACSAGGSPTPGASTPGASTPSTAASASPSESAAASASAGAGGTAEVDAEDSSLGKILVDADGNTIYFFAKDEEGQSACTATCLTTWPAVQVAATPEAGGGVTATLGTFTRDDGTTQLTVNDYPAYYFAGDSAPGDTNGQKVGGIWFVFGADGKPIKK